MAEVKNTNLENDIEPEPESETETDEVIYDPYNTSNVVISYRDIRGILNQYGVYYTVQNIEIYKRAFIHSSYLMPTKLSNKVSLANPTIGMIELKKESNERDEFLGDGILEAITKHYLYKRFPNENEGFMTEKKIALVKNEHLGMLAMQMGLNKWYIMSKSGESRGIRTNYKQLGCLFEAFLGALYLDANEIQINHPAISEPIKLGFHMCQTFMENIYNKLVNWTSILETNDNYKIQFQVRIQKVLKVTPQYYIMNQEREQLDAYCMGVYVCSENKILDKESIELSIPYTEIMNLSSIDLTDTVIYFSQASHKIKKKAEQLACKIALKLLENNPNE